MKRSEAKTFRWIVSLVAGFILASGCGDIVTPGGDNAAYTGSVLRVFSITVKDYASGSDEVDVVQNVCRAGQLEDFGNVEMVAVLKNDSPATSQVTSATKVQILSYKVEFFSNDEGAVPLDSFEVYESYFLQPGQSISPSLLLMSMDTKFEFISKGGDPYLFPVYQVKVTFYGINEFGYEVKGWGSTRIQVGDWDNC